MNREEYLAAKPFPHAVLPDLAVWGIEQELLKRAAAELAETFERTKTDGNLWRIKQNEQSRKYGTSHYEVFGEASREVFGKLLSPEFAQRLSELTGIEKLIADPTLEGGGYHLIDRGGFLKVHADFNFSRELKLYRRVNLLCYLNEDWDSSYGGDLELWDAERCVVAIPPEFGKTVVFTSTDTSYHGHPHPLNTPEGVYRKSIAVYYYTEEKPETTCEGFHSTLYV